MHQSLEVRIVDGPSGWRKSALMVVNREVAVQRFVRRFADLSENEEYLLVHLSAVSHHHEDTTRTHTHEPSETDITRGASKEDLFMELLEPLEPYELSPYIRVRQGMFEADDAHTFMLYRFRGSGLGRWARVGERTGTGVGPLVLVWSMISSVVDVAGVVDGSDDPICDESSVEVDMRGPPLPLVCWPGNVFSGFPFVFAVEARLLLRCRRWKMEGMVALVVREGRGRSTKAYR